MANPKNAAWYGAGFGFLMPDAGQVFYVDGSNGLDANSGLQPDLPFLTIKHAMDQCTGGNDDYIIVLAYPSTPPGDEDWPILVDVDNVHLIGSNLFMASPRAWIAPDENEAAFQISVGSVEIAGFDLGAGAAHGCIENDGTVWRAYIHHNDFALIRTAQDGIKMTGAVDCPHWLVEHNQFGPTIDRSGIRIEHNSTRSVFQFNRFYVPSGVRGFHAQGLCTAIGYVLDNTFKVADDRAGDAVYFENANATMCNVQGNRVASGSVAMATNPYRDLGAGNHWGRNFAGTLLTYPVVV